MINSSDNQLINPFVGLRAFEEREDYLFFGRNKQISELLQKFKDSRFLVVIGSSGSGKSSLVKSGLLPAIYSGFLTVGSNWRVAVMRPGENPIGYLAKELASEGTLYSDTTSSNVPYQPIIESSLRRSENGLVQVYKDAHLDARENLLVVVDQFEELFRFNKYEKQHTPGKSDAIHFIQILLAAAQQKECPVYVLLTMRSDFLGDCAEFRGLPEAINEGQYLVPRMIRDEIREAITGPVAVSTATITQRLVTRLLNDLNNDTDQLPILQHAMMRTWDAWHKRNQPATPIDFEDYEKIGTMKSALSLHADEAYAELPTEKERKICELMFKALTDNASDLRGIRRPRSIADLCLLTGGSIQEVINEVEIFRKPGRTFLMPPLGIDLTEKSVIDISHESLMRVWQRLVLWTEEEIRSGELFMRLANSAQLKEQGQRGLLKNPELEITLNWKEKNKPIAKWAEGYKANFEQAMTYLEDSRKEDLAEKKFLADKEATRKRLVRTIMALLLLGIIASIIIVINSRRLIKEANEGRQEAIKQREIAEKATKEATKSDNLRNIALIKAESSAEEAFQKQKLANSSAKLAELKQQEALHNAEVAKQEQKRADSNATIARKKTIETVKQNLKIAANEYARLIREGPSVENKNKNEFYGKNYLLAYEYHFAQLEDSTATADTTAYKALKNKLYYNNDLYQRLFEGLEKTINLADVIRLDNNLNFNPGSKLAGFNNATGRIDTTGGKLTISNGINTNKNGSDPKSKTSQEFLSFAISKNQQRLFCSTNDNLIYVFDNKLNKVDSISMGARVTALDFNDTGSIIYFGTSGGYIGYIDYGRFKKNQPVFENKLESEITAIQVFTHSHKDKLGNDIEENFLLATGLKSSPRVYKLSADLKPDSRLFGNVLPYTEKQYGKIIRAAFSADSKRVILVTPKVTYSWNPFTYEILEYLKRDKSFNPAASWVNNSEIKIY